jgi:hypothetical protein
MSLEGLRAWIGEVERKLGKRTRVFLALAVIAIGLGGAATYLAIDTRESSVSEGDVRELQEKLEARIDETATGAGGTAAPPVEPRAGATPNAETEPTPDAEPQTDAKGADDARADDATGGVGGGGVTGGAGGAKIQELLEQAKEQSADAKRDQAEK